MLYNRRKTLAEREYDIEVAMLHGRLVISAVDLIMPETIVVDIPADKSNFGEEYDLNHRQANHKDVQ